MKTTLFIIDMQNDFCLPDGALYIPGAEKDVEKLAGFIARESKKIDQIILTQDNHHVLDIAHPGFWRDTNGQVPPVYTSITFADVKAGKWIPVFEKEKVLVYLKELENQGEYPHTIWPEHSLIGSTGAAIVPLVLDKVTGWAKQGKYYELIVKGTNPLTEHFGAFRANIPAKGAPETQLNLDLIEKLKNTDRIVIAGEAKSHCVANTIKQLFDFPEIAKKLIILDDCMTNVQGFESIAEPIYKQAVKLGAQITNTNDFKL